MISHLLSGSGPMFQYYCHGISISTQPRPVNRYTPLRSGNGMCGGRDCIAMMLDHRSSPLGQRLYFPSAKAHRILDYISNFIAVCIIGNKEIQ